MRCFAAIATLLFACQGAFWYHTHDALPEMGIVPDVPGRETVQALSLGDSQAFFRLLGLRIQNAGDTFGRFTPLREYDYNKLYHWFRLLDTLDHRSHYIPSMATYYFSQSQNREDVRYIIDYLLEHTEGRVEEKWWWLVQAIYLANHKLEDEQLALTIARRLEGDHKIPLWARQMPAFVLEKQGEFDAALKIIEHIIQSEEEIKQGELNFMRYFVEERLGKLNQLTEAFDARQAELDAQQEPANQEAD